MMNKKEPSRRPTAPDEGEQSRSTPVLIPPPREGRAQIPRKGMMGPNAILGKPYSFVSDFHRYPADQCQPKSDPLRPWTRSRNKCPNHRSNSNPSPNPARTTLPSYDRLHYLLPHPPTPRDSHPPTTLGVTPRHHRLLIPRGALRWLLPVLEVLQLELSIRYLGEKQGRWSRFRGSGEKS
jgi:hypothetical protein